MGKLTRVWQWWQKTSYEAGHRFGRWLGRAILGSPKDW